MIFAYNLYILVAMVVFYIKSLTFAASAFSKKPGIYLKANHVDGSHSDDELCDAIVDEFNRISLYTEKIDWAPNKEGVLGYCRQRDNIVWIVPSSIIRSVRKSFGDKASIQDVLRLTRNVLGHERQHTNQTRTWRRFCHDTFDYSTNPAEAEAIIAGYDYMLSFE